MIWWVFLENDEAEACSVAHLLEEHDWAWGEDVHAVCGYYLFTVGTLPPKGRWKWGWYADTLYKTRMCPTCQNFSYLKELE